MTTDDKLKLNEILKEIDKELEWLQETLRCKLKFGLPESEAIKRRESRSKGVLLTSREKIEEMINIIGDGSEEG